MIHTITIFWLYLSLKASLRKYNVHSEHTHAPTYTYVHAQSYFKYVTHYIDTNLCIKRVL